MALLVKPGRETPESWIAAFAELMPDLEVRIWPHYGDPQDIEFAAVSRMPSGALRQFPNLRFIASIPVGVDHLLNDPDLPPHVPLVRSVNAERSGSMAEYVVLHVLRYFRRFPDYQEQQQRRHWERLPQRWAAEFRVGLMGLGALGRAAAERLRPFGFDLACWTRTPHPDAGIANFVGRTQLEPFLARSDVVVCMLPLTEQTRDVLDARRLAALPRGACLINCARGEHVVEADLLAALDSGQLAGATLDAFRTEPLPDDHPFWRHPRVTVTPHNSGGGRSIYGAMTIAENISRIRDGRPLLHLVDRAAGY